MKTLLSIALGCLALGCDDEAPPDPCAHDFEPRLEIGQGVSDAFLRFGDEEDVGLVVAPQGGFGVDVRVSTIGLVAGEGVLSTLLLETVVDDVVVGSFENPGQKITCVPERGGLITGIVVGFDPDDYATNEDLLRLDGQRVVLRVTVSDQSGVQARGEQPVKIRAGG